MEAKPIGVVVVEDAVEQRERVCEVIQAAEGFECLGSFGSAEEALEGIPRLQPDIVLMDIHLPGRSGIECVRELKQRLPALRIMMLTVFEDHERIFQSLAAGATGYLLKKAPPAKLLEAIEELHGGGAPMSGQIARQVVGFFQQPPIEPPREAELTGRERDILRLLARGFLYKEIADQLGLSVGTVRTHICHIYEKLHVRSRTEAVVKAFGAPLPGIAQIFRL